MATMNRTDTINSLALAMGVNTTKNYDSKRYDTQTGTIYCNNRPVSNDTIKNAINYFETLRQRCAKSESAEIKNVANYYDIAISALSAYNDQKILETGKKLAI